MSSPRKQITFTVDARGCHNCTSHALNTHGYPTLSVANRQHHMHRVLFEEAFGELKSGEVVRHKCDNRSCINLDHLEPGTCAQNSMDMKIRGRCGAKRGASRSDAKLTLAQVLEIANSSETQQTVADRYGISQSTVSRIKSGQRWPDRKGSTDVDPHSEG